MKIAILRQRVAGIGGAETTLVHLARGLAAQGHEVTVYGTETPQAAAPVLGPGISYTPVPVWGGKAGRVLTYALNSRRLLQRFPVQVVFSLERTFFQQVYRAGDGCHREWLQRRARFLSPGVRLAQGFSLFHRVMLGVEARLFAHPGLKRVIVNSRQVQEEIIRHYRLDPERIRLVYNGLDHQRFQPLSEAARAELLKQWGVPKGARIVLFLGSGFGRKGLGFLMEAFQGLPQESLLWVVGKGAPGPYQRLVRGEAGARVKFWGPRRDAAPFYQAASALALPTIYDPCSNVALEALACGTPVITTDANGAAEFLTPGVNGEILSRPDDLAGLKSALAAYLERGLDPQVRRAAQEAVSSLSWERTVAQTLAVLEEAALS